MSELRDRLERLAARGSRRGADDVLGAALRGAPREEIAIVPDFDGPDLPIIGDEVPFVTADPERRRRGRFGTVVAAFGIAALLGVGMLAITSIFGNGGASSPEGAVKQLADAISHKDPLAAVDVLSPTEVRSMRETVNHATRRAADLKIVNDASAPLAGIDLSVDHLQLSTQALGDGFTKVTITGGEISATTHKEALSKLVQDAAKGDSSATEKADLARLASASDLPTFVVTVRHDGRWYVSPAYTALEYAREADGGPAADFGSANAKIAELGSDTPENAVGDALHALQAGNWDRLMALAPPDELPVYDYRAWINEVAADSHPDFTIDKLTTTADVSGDTATVKLDASGTMGSGEDKSKWQVGGTCPDPYGISSPFSAATGSLSSADEGLFYDDDGASTSTETFTNSIQLCVSGDLGNLVPFGLMRLGADGSTAGNGSVSVEVVRENGRWFVSPVTTVLRAVDATIEHLDQRTVYSIAGLAYQLPPDGNITLDQPFTAPGGRSYFNSSVFAFDGTKGQEVVGEIGGSNEYASGEIYTAAGKEIDYLEFSTTKNGYAYPVTLPETGSYRLILNGVSGKDAKLTLWDTKHAPKGLIESHGSGIGEVCTTTGNTETCSLSGDSVTLCPNEPSSADGKCLSYPVGGDGSVDSGAGSSGSGSSKSVTATTSAGASPTVAPAPHATPAPTVPAATPVGVATTAP